MAQCTPWLPLRPGAIGVLALGMSPTEGCWKPESGFPVISFNQVCRAVGLVVFSQISLFRKGAVGI